MMLAVVLVCGMMLSCEAAGDDEKCREYFKISLLVKRLVIITSLYILHNYILYLSKTAIRHVRPHILFIWLGLFIYFDVSSVA